MTQVAGSLRSGSPRASADGDARRMALLNRVQRYLKSTASSEGSATDVFSRGIQAVRSTRRSSPPAAPPVVRNVTLRDDANRSVAASRPRPTDRTLQRSGAETDRGGSKRDQPPSGSSGSSGQRPRPATSRSLSAPRGSSTVRLRNGPAGGASSAAWRAGAAEAKLRRAGRVRAVLTMVANPRLEQLFVHYASFGRRDNANFIDSAQFQKLARDYELCAAGDGSGGGGLASTRQRGKAARGGGAEHQPDPPDSPTC